MNRILRPTLSMRTTRATFVVALMLMLSGSIFGQLSNCPSEIVNAITTTFPSCQADYSVTGVTTAGVNPIEWFSTGATVNSAQPISSLEMGVPFNYGLTQITISDQISTCSIALLVSENALIPTDYCDDIIVDITDGCMGEETLPDLVALQNVECEPAVPHDIAFSWAMSTIEPTLILTHADLGTTSRTVWTQKYRNGNLFRTASCEIDVTVVDNTVPSLTCPTDLTVAVAESCSFLYTYDVASSAVVPCGGTLSQYSGDLSGTALAAGGYTYGFAIYDVNNSTVDDCSWIVTVEQSELAATQMNCIAELNISIDENCEATIDASNLLTGNLCADISLLHFPLQYLGRSF